MGDDLSADLASLRIDRGGSGGDRPPRNKTLWYAIGGVAAVAGILIGFVIPAFRGRLFKTEVALTEIMMVSPAQASVQLTSTGYVVPQTLSQVAAKVGGRVAEVRVKQGQEVKAGDVLLVLEKSDQEAALMAMRNRVLVDRARAETAKADLAETELKLARERKLAESGVVAGATVEDLDKRAASLRASLKAAETSIKASAAEAESSAVLLANYTVTSPISGTVLNKPPEVGEMVGPVMGGIASNVGGVEIADMSTLAVETDVPEARLRQVILNGPAEIILDAYPDKRYRGETYEIVPKVNRSKATVTVKVRFTDPATGVLPEMSARVSFLSKKVDDDAIKQPPMVVLPKEAIAQRAGKKVVFAYESGRVRMVPVEIGSEAAGGFEMRQGPPAGTRVIKNPPEDLTDGQVVKESTDS
jgi:RND family efflux transporter MFP subunit